MKKIPVKILAMRRRQNFSATRASQPRAATTSSHVMDFSAVILAGGRSSRMGRDKAFLKIDGQTLLSRQIALARSAGAEAVYLSGRPATDYSATGCPVLMDAFPGCGPLAGVERGLATSRTPWLLVLAVDLPAINAEFLARLLRSCSKTGAGIPRLNGQIEPLLACYPRAAQAEAGTRLAAGNHSVADFARYCVESRLAAFLDLPAAEAPHFSNWNSPQDLPCLT